MSRISALRRRALRLVVRCAFDRISRASAAALRSAARRRSWSRRLGRILRAYLDSTSAAKGGSLPCRTNFERVIGSPPFIPEANSSNRDRVKTAGAPKDGWPWPPLHRWAGLASYFVRDLAEKLLDLPSEGDPKGESCQHRAYYRPDHRCKEVIIDYCGHRRLLNPRQTKHVERANACDGFHTSKQFLVREMCREPDADHQSGNRTPPALPSSLRARACSVPVRQTKSPDRGGRGSSSPLVVLLRVSRAEHRECSCEIVSCGRADRSGNRRSHEGGSAARYSATIWMGSARQSGWRVGVAAC